MADQDISIEDTNLTVWEERDRLHIALYLKSDEKLDDPLLDLWDEAAREAFEDGFLKAGWLKDEDPTLKASAFKYAKEMGMFDPANRVKVEPVPVGYVIVHEDLGVYMTWYAGGIDVWSSTATDAELAKGAYSFADEPDAQEWEEVFCRGIEEEEIKDFLSKLSYVEVVRDVTLEGHTMPRRHSLEALENAGVDLKLPAAAPSI